MLPGCFGEFRVFWGLVSSGRLVSSSFVHACFCRFIGCYQFFCFFFFFCGVSGATRVFLGVSGLGCCVTREFRV